MAKGVPKPVTRVIIVSRQSVARSVATMRRLLTHEGPVSQPEEASEGVEGDGSARALGVVVRAGELGTSGREATAGDEVGGHSGADSGSGVHLGSIS